MFICKLTNKIKISLLLTLLLFIILVCFSFIIAKASDSPNAPKNLEELNKMASENINTNPNKALELSTDAQKLAEKVGDDKAIVQALINSGLAYAQLGNIEEAQAKFEKSRELSKKISYSKGEGNSENQLGVVYFDQGLYDQAMQHFIKALNIRTSLGDKIGKSKTINNIGRVHDKLGNYDKAIDLFKQSLALKEDEDLSGKVNTLNNLGLAYRGKGDFNSALNIFNEAMKLSDKIQFLQGKGYSSMSLGETYNMMGDLLKAEKYALNATELYKKIDYKQGVSYALYHTGLIYFNMNQLEKAMEYYKLSESIALQTKQNSLIKDISLEKARVFESKGEYHQALEFYKKFVDLSKKVINSDMQQKILVLQNQYETEAKENEIKLLEKVSASKSAEISYQRLLLITSSVFLIVCILITLYLFKQISQRKKKEIELLRVTNDLEKANNQLNILAGTDFLTKLSNRRHFDIAFHDVCHRAECDCDNLSVILMDIDFFKQYNDIYGHQQGDECLVQVTTTLRGAFCGVDSLVARYGGEEFIIVLRVSGEEASIQADIVRHQIQGLNLLHNGSTLKQVTCSFGVSDVKNVGKYDPELLILAADKSLYEAKSTGRNKVVHVNEPVNEPVNEFVQTL